MQNALAAVLWLQVAASGTGAVIEVIAGGLPLARIDEKALRLLILLTGLALTIGLFAGAA
jgi:hypothetical protein